MDDGNGDQKNNDAQSDVKQNCVENTNSLTPSSDNCVTKKTSFEITSITEPNNDDNDEDSPDTDSHIHDHRTENRHESDLQSYAENIVVYNSSNDLGSSAPVIPTSSQYGLAIVDNSDSGQSLGSVKNEDIHGVDANSQKSECDLNGLQNKNRNERFKVVKIESTEPFKRGRWVCMDFLDHSMNQQQPGNNKIIMVNGDNKAYSQANELDSTESLDNGHQESSEFRVSTNNVSTYTTNCNTTDNYKNQTSAYNIVSSGVTTPIHSACVSPGQSLQTNMQVPVLTSQPIATSVQATQPQSLTQVQLPAQHNVNQGCIPHSSLQSHQIQQVIANASVMQPQLQPTQPVINVMQNQNQSIQAQTIQHLNSVDQHVTQTMPQYQQPMSQANLQQQIMQQHNMPAQFQKSFVSQNQSVLPNCAPLQPSVNQIINQQVPQYYNSPPIQSQNVTSESSTTVPMSNQHISQPYQSIPIQNQPLQSHVQLQQNQQLPPVQQMQQPSPQQNMVQQNQMQPQMVQQNQQMSHQPSISQSSQPQQTQTVPQQTQQLSQQHIQQTQQTPQSQQTHVQQVTSTQQQGSQQMQQVGQQIQTPQSSQIQQQLPQQTHHITQISQMTNQSQQMSQSNQMQQQIAQPNQQIPQQPQQIPLQNQQIPQQTQLQHPKQMQTSQIQSQPQQINQQQISQQQIGQIAGQNQMIHQNNQQINHTGQMISQQTHSQGQQLNQQNQVQQQQQQQQPQQQIQQQLTQTSQSSQPITQQILQPNQSMSQQNQVLPQQLGLNQSNSQMSVPQSQNQQVIQPQQPQHMQQPSQQYQQPQQMMQSQPQQLPMQTNQPIMHQPTYSQAQSLSAMQLQQAVMQIPTNTVTSTQMHIQQQQPVVPSNMIQQSQINVMSQNNIQPSIPPMSQQQMTYSLQQHVPINQNYANMQSCYIPSQQQNMTAYKPSMKTVETVNKKKEDTNSEDVDNGTTNSGTTTVAIDNKIEQAMDLVKSHLMYAVREEVEVLKEKIAELMDKVGLLETENSNLRMLVPPEILEQYNREKQKPANSQSTHNQ